MLDCSIAKLLHRLVNQPFNNITMKQLLIICGPTATGKTALALHLAKKFGGELISADSRQVYRGMDIGTGKDIDQKSKIKNQNEKLNPSFTSPLIKGRRGGVNKKFTVGFRNKDEVPIWLVDIVEPDYVFNVGEFKQLAEAVIQDIWQRGKLPIIVGGTGLYVRALLRPWDGIFIPPNASLRQKLDKLTVEELQTELKKNTSEKFESMNHSDRFNPRRLVRAIEVEEWKKQNVHNSPLPSLILREGFPPLRLRGGQGALRTDNLLIGLTAPPDELFHRIDARVDERMKQGVLGEIEKLLKKGYSWEKPAMSGLGYREWEPFFENSEPKSQNSKLISEIIERWKLDEKQYAKRQLTWFKKEAGIEWFDVTSSNYQIQVIEMVDKWYNKQNV